MDDYEFDDTAAFDVPAPVEDPLGEELAGLRRELLDGAARGEAPPRHATPSLDRWAEDFALLPAGQTAERLAMAWGNLLALLVDAGTEGDDAAGWGRVRRTTALGMQALLGRPEWASLHAEFAEEVFPLLANAAGRARAGRVRRLREVTARLEALAHHHGGAPHLWRLAGLTGCAYPALVSGSWLGREGVEVTGARVTAVAHALLETLRAGPERPLVVGYDSRLHADRLAVQVTETALRLGVPVHLDAAPLPTPALLHYLREALGGQAAGVLVCTASRRPVREPDTGRFTGHPWQGVRAFGSDGLPLTSIASAAVSRRAMTLLLEPCESPAAGADVTMIDPLDAYQQHLLAELGQPVRTRDDEMSMRDALRAYWTRPGARIVVDGLFGAVRGCLETLCHELALPVEGLHASPDPLFGTLTAADPVPAQLDALMTAVKKARDGAGPRIGLAFDADGDRFGVVDEHGAFLPPDTVAALCADFLLAEGYRGAPGVLLRTRDTGHAVARVAATHPERLLAWTAPLAEDYRRFAGELPALDALVDGAALTDALAALPAETLLLAADAGNGLAFGPARTPDGLRAALLLLTLCAVRRAPAGRLWRRLLQRIGPGGGEQLHLMAPARVVTTVVNGWQDDYERFGDAGLSTRPLAGCAVRGVGGIRDVLTEFHLADPDGRPAYLLLRADPEAPRLYAYAEAAAAPAVHRLLAVVRERVLTTLADAVGRTESLWQLVDLLAQAPVEAHPGWRFPGTLAEQVYSRLQELARPGLEAPALLRLITERLRAVSPERATALALAAYPVAATPRAAPPIPHVHWESEDR